MNCAQCQISFTMMYTSECIACNSPFVLDKTTKLCGCPIGYESFTDPASKQLTWCAACCIWRVLLPGWSSSSSYTVWCQPPHQPCICMPGQGLPEWCAPACCKLLPLLTSLCVVCSIEQIYYGGGNAGQPVIGG